MITTLLSIATMTLYMNTLAEPVENFLTERTNGCSKTEVIEEEKISCLKVENLNNIVRELKQNTNEEIELEALNNNGEKVSFKAKAIRSDLKHFYIQPYEMIAEDGKLTSIHGVCVNSDTLKAYPNQKSFLTSVCPILSDNDLINDNLFVVFAQA